MIRTALAHIREWLTRLVEGAISSEDERKIAAWQDDRRGEQADRTFATPTAGQLEPSAADLDAIRADGVADDDQPVEHTPRSLRRVDLDGEPVEYPHGFIGRHARPNDIEHRAITVLAARTNVGRNIPDNQTEPSETGTTPPPPGHARPDDSTQNCAIAVFLDWLMIEHRCGIDLLRARLTRMRAEAFL